MTSKKMLWVAAPLLAAAVAVILWRPHASAPATREQQPEIARLRAELDELHAAVKAVERRPTVTLVNAQEAAPAAAANVAPTPPEAASAAPTPQTAQDVIDEKAARFTSEPVDRAWSQQTVTYTTQQLTPLLSKHGATLRNVECRTTICRAETVHRDKDSFREFAHDTFSPTGLDWRAPYMMSLEKGADGQTVGVLYLEREAPGLRSLPISKPQ